MRNRCLGLLAILMLFGGRALAADAAAGQAAAFLKQHGLEEVHAACLKSITAMAEGRPETASEVLLGAFPQGADPASRDALRKGVTQIAGRLVAKGCEDVELVGASTVSRKAIVLRYVANTRLGPTCFSIMAIRYRGAWRIQWWHWEEEPEKILERLRGAVRFSDGEAAPVGTQGKKA